jgi:hypothetical protein
MSGRKLTIWPGRSGNGPVAVAISGALSTAGEEPARKAAHDLVVEQAGRRRAGPVHWVVLPYVPDGLQHLDRLGLSADSGLHEFLRGSPLSLLVLAMTATDKPRRPGRRKARRR